ncbi:MAG: hypothetical protein ACYS8K_10200 [Planctomycetota bacterium]|jgi:agarase
MRGRAIALTVLVAAAWPAFVGCRWFAYVDEPVTGRAADGENSNCGLLSITDTPYRELAGAAREVHAGIYRRRHGPQ